MTLHWAQTKWQQGIDDFNERHAVISYGSERHDSAPPVPLREPQQETDWVAIGMRYASANPPDWREFAVPRTGAELCRHCGG